MKRALTILVGAAILLIFEGSGKNMNTKAEQSLIDSRGGAQSLLSGNAQANGFIPQSVTLQGRLAWHRFYSEIDSMLQPAPRRVLINGGVIGVVLQEDLLLYDTAGNAIGREILADGGLAAFGPESYCWTTDNRQLSCKNYNGEAIIDGHAIPLFNDRSQLRLLYPIGNEFVAVRQFFSGLPVRNTPTEADAYRMEFGKSAWEWIFEQEGVVLATLVTASDDRMVLIGADSFQVIAMANGKDLGAFPTGMTRIESVFLTLADELVIFGQASFDGNEHSLVRTLALDGTRLWEYQLVLPLNRHLPACNNQGRVYFANAGFITCLEDGKELWRDRKSVV
jgi:hypothetical protein